MRRTVLSVCAAGLWAAACGNSGLAAGVEPVTIDFTTMPAFSGPQLVVGDLIIRAANWDGSARNVTVQPGVGLGVSGGTSDARIDSGERLTFRFANGDSHEHLWLSFSNATDRNGNGVPGDGLLHCFSPAGSYLGGQNVRGGHGEYATGLVDGSPIGEFYLEGIDDFSLAKLTFVPVEGELRVAQFTQLGSFTTPELVVGDLRVIATTAEGTAGHVHVLEGHGLGVVGGMTELVVDSGESLTYEFMGDFPDHVWVHIGSTSNGDGNGTVGEVFIYPETPDGRVMPPIQVSHPSRLYMNSLLRGAPVRRFTITAQGLDAHAVSQVVYVLPRTACPSDMDGDGQVGAADLAALLGSWGPCR